MKNNYFIDPFLKILPTIDLHGETSDTIVWLLKDFINMNYSLGKEKIVIIHGRHGNTLRKATHEYLKTNNLVSRYYLYNFNDGITIVELKPHIKLL